MEEASITKLLLAKAAMGVGIVCRQETAWWAHATTTAAQSCPPLMVQTGSSAPIVSRRDQGLEPRPRRAKTGIARAHTGSMSSVGDAADPYNGAEEGVATSGNGTSLSSRETTPTPSLTIGGGVFCEIDIKETGSRDLLYMPLANTGSSHM